VPKELVDIGTDAGSRARSSVTSAGGDSWPRSRRRRRSGGCWSAGVRRGRARKRRTPPYAASGARPNVLWQIDATKWAVDDHARQVEIIDIVDDHSRVAIAPRAVEITTCEEASAAFGSGVAGRCCFRSGPRSWWCSAAGPRRCSSDGCARCSSSSAPTPNLEELYEPDGEFGVFMTTLEALRRHGPFNSVFWMPGIPRAAGRRARAAGRLQCSRFAGTAWTIVPPAGWPAVPRCLSKPCGPCRARATPDTGGSGGISGARGSDGNRHRGRRACESVVTAAA
jgi:hypothetical protein